MRRSSFAFWFTQLIVLAALVMVTGTTRLYAQVDTGSISGTVEDQSGGVIPGAKVTLTNEGTNATLSVTTGPAGNYTFNPVRIGSYTLSATFEGFQTTTQKGVVVNVRADVVIDFKLAPGAVTQTVEVTASTPLLTTQNASVGQVVGSHSVNTLPLNGRNFTFLAQLVAGVNTPQADTRGNAATGAFAANGLRPAQNNYLLDGIDNNSDTVDFLNGTNFVVLPPVDAVQEFKVQTTNFSAEFGRSGAAILNATIKSGTNNFHGTVWEFLRNDVLDAADFFENAGNTKKGKYRQNQFGAAVGGPIVKDKIFFFGDFEGLRRRQGSVRTGTVPTIAERNSLSSAFADFSDLLSQGGSRSDLLGRSIPNGAVLDPATTRPVTAGVVDPVTGLTATGDGFVRDQFPGNLIPIGRLDTNAIQLMNLYPLPNSSSLFSNFTNSPVLSEDRNAYDVRVDANLNDKNQLFGRWSFVNDPQFIPAIFGGVADGGGFQQGTQTARSKQGALVWTHTFSPTVVNVARAGISYIHTSRFSPSANELTDLPGQFGIMDIPQDTLNGGLPAFGINGMQTLGSNAFLPSDEVSSTIQISDDFTKIYGKHTFKMGIEVQHVKFSTLQPPWSRGEFDYNGAFTDIPNVGGGNTGRAAFLLTPIASTVPGGVDFLGGPTSVFVSNISLTDNGKNYYGGYFNDDWKVSSKLTINLGVRWDFFGLTGENHSNQANFVPGGAPSGQPLYLIPNGANSGNLSTDPVTGFTTLLAKDGIGLMVTDQYGDGLGKSQKSNFAPRVGFAYQFTPKLVVRGGFGIFYNGFENRGFSPNIGENYPFQFNFQFFNPDDNHPINNFQGCATATPAGGPTLETGFSCTPLSPLLVNAGGLALRGIQFDYQTPYSMGGNFTVQYQMTPSMSVQAGYVTSLARHLETFPGTNRVSQILPPGTDTNPFIPFKDFGRNSSYAATQGSSYYHGLQITVEKQYASGFNFLGTYTFSQTRSDSGDLLNGGSQGGYRAPYVTGFGIQGDYQKANFDIRNVLHFSGGYELPIGNGKRFMSSASGAANMLAGGWSIIWSTTIQGGQPLNIGCNISTVSADLGCDALLTGDPYSGPHNVDQFLNPAAFSNPTPATAIGQTDLSPLGGEPSQVRGPGFGRMDFSIFKDFQLNERLRLQFRSEFFNIFNHPNFNAPGFGGNGVVAVPGSTNFGSGSFGQIGSTRDAPNDPRQIQFALKLYF
jgi:Carboxypeptidase regulatory-like domain